MLLALPDDVTEPLKKFDTMCEQFGDNYSEEDVIEVLYKCLEDTEIGETTREECSSQKSNYELNADMYEEYRKIMEYLVKRIKEI